MKKYYWTLILHPNTCLFDDLLSLSDYSTWCSLQQRKDRVAPLKPGTLHFHENKLLCKYPSGIRNVLWFEFISRDRITCVDRIQTQLEPTLERAATTLNARIVNSLSLTCNGVSPRSFVMVTSAPAAKRNVTWGTEPIRAGKISASYQQDSGWIARDDDKSIG